jgi:hypothetical protein
VEVRDELVSHGSDLSGIDGWEREPDGAAGVGHRDPAVDELLSQFGCHLVRVEELAEVEGVMTGRGR